MQELMIAEPPINDEMSRIGIGKRPDVWDARLLTVAAHGGAWVLIGEASTGALGRHHHSGKFSGFEFTTRVQRPDGTRSAKGRVWLYCRKVK